MSRTIEKLFEDVLNNVKYTIPDDSGEKGNDRFGSIINFPNFLLHTLKIMYFLMRMSIKIILMKKLN